MMKCSRAGCGGDTEVIDSRDRWRPSDRPWDHHYRRRRCLKCGHRFSTIEEAVPYEHKQLYLFVE